MAIRIGDQYSFEKVRLRDFGKLAGDDKLAGPLVRTRLTETAARVRDAFPKAPFTNPVAEKVDGFRRVFRP